MSFLRYVARRALFAVVSVYVIITAVFVMINLTVPLRAGERVAVVRHECRGASRHPCPGAEELEKVRQSYLSARNLDIPVYERYVGWLVDITTFRWGYSFSYRRPVFEVLDGRVPTTLEYVLPGFALAVVFGVLLGLFAALARNGVFDWSVRLTSYVLLGVPVFMAIFYMQYLTGARVVAAGGYALEIPRVHPQVIAGLAVAVGLLAGQIRFARVSALEQTGKLFVKMLKAKGIDRIRLARHVLRNAAIPIVSLSVSELLAVLVLNIYVIEPVLGIDGLAGATLQAVRETDIPLVMSATMVVVFFGITGSFLLDVLYGFLDPRIRAE